MKKPMNMVAAMPTSCWFTPIIRCVRGARRGAHQAIERALALDPLNPRTRRVAGSIDFAVRDYAGAAENYRAALKLNPHCRLPTPSLA